jgi:hypothetical protein
MGGESGYWFLIFVLSGGKKILPKLDTLLNLSTSCIQLRMG